MSILSTFHIQRLSLFPIQDKWLPQSCSEYSADGLVQRDLWHGRYVLVPTQQPSGRSDNIAIATARALLRAGLPLPQPPKPTDPQRVVLLSIPLFHVTGCLSWLLRAITNGSKFVTSVKWDVKEAVRLIVEEGVHTVGG